MKNTIEVKIERQTTDPYAWIVNVYQSRASTKKKLESKMFDSREGMKKYIENLKSERSSSQ